MSRKGVSFDVLGVSTDKENGSKFKENGMATSEFVYTCMIGLLAIA